MIKLLIADDHELMRMGLKMLFEGTEAFQKYILDQEQDTVKEVIKCVKFVVALPVNVGG